MDLILLGFSLPTRCLTNLTMKVILKVSTYNKLDNKIDSKSRSDKHDAKIATNLYGTVSIQISIRRGLRMKKCKNTSSRKSNNVINNSLKANNGASLCFC